MILAIVVAGMVGATIWFLRNERSSNASPLPHVAATPVRPPPEAPFYSEIAKSVPVPKKGTQTDAPDRVPSPTITADDLKIDEILRLLPGNTDGDHTGAAQSLINLLATLTKDGQIACAHHISNLISDKEYNRVMHIWRNPASHREVIAVLSADIMNRDNRVKLPALLDALRQPTHPFHEEAKSILPFLLDADFGNDFGKWNSALKILLNREGEARLSASQLRAVSSPGLPQ
jgi:hypothetical protein